MATIIDLLLVALVTIYIVDLSGFTNTFLDFVSGLLNKKVTQLKPFTCSLCMVWWVCLAFLLMSAKLSLPMVALSALLSFLSTPLAQLLIFVRESVLGIANKLLELWD